MVRLATRKPYKTERVLNNTFCGLHWDSLLDTMDGSELQANAVFSKMSKKELETYSRLKKAVFTARFNEMLREGFASEEGDSFKARNILLVERFLNELEKGKKNG